MKFTIRDVLLLTVIAAMALGWWLEHRQLSRPVAPPIADHFELVTGGERNDKLFLLNPRTGEVWQRAGDPSYGESHWKLHNSTFAEKK